LKVNDSSFLNQNGIENIRTRVRLLNGEVEIHSEIGLGTKLRIEVGI
jgi:signal transduction histidine kinase